MACTVECCYNVAQYNKILHTSFEKLRQNINQRLNPQKNTPYLALMGKLWDVFCNWPCYNGTVLYMIATWLLYRCHWGWTLGNTWHSFICLLWWHIMNLAQKAASYQGHVWQGQVKGEVGASDAWAYMPWNYGPWLNIIVYCCGTQTLHLFCLV